MINPFRRAKNRRSANQFVNEVFGDWAGQRLVLTGHVVRRSEDEDLQVGDERITLRGIVWIGLEPDATLLFPISAEAMDVIEGALPGEDIPTTINRLAGHFGPERLKRMRTEELAALVHNELARLVAA